MLIKLRGPKKLELQSGNQKFALEPYAQAILSMAGIPSLVSKVRHCLIGSI